MAWLSPILSMKLAAASLLVLAVPQTAGRKLPQGPELICVNDADPAGLGRNEASRNVCSIPVDDVLAEDTGKWEPWAYPPFCVHSNSTDNTQYCVYTSSTFNMNRGISFIVTPETAANIVGSVLNPQPGYEARHYLTDYGMPANQLGYKLAEIPGKGLGLVATRKIKRAEVFQVGLPAIIQDDQVLQEVSHNDRLRLLRRAFRQLPDSNRALSLAKAKTGSLYEKVIRANGFEVMIGGKKHTSLYPEISRINHGCDSNASARFGEKSLAMEAFAQRDIEPGQEIEFNYIPLDMTYEERQAALAVNFDFKCTCSLCSASEALRRKSDANRKKMHDLWAKLQDPDTSHADAVKFADDLYFIARGEVPDAKIREYDLGLMGIFYDFHDYARAIRHTRDALSWSELFENPAEDSLVNLRANLQALEGLKEAQERAAKQRGGEVSTIMEKREEPTDAAYYGQAQSM